MSEPEKLGWCFELGEQLEDFVPNHLEWYLGVVEEPPVDVWGSSIWIRNYIVYLSRFLLFQRSPKKVVDRFIFSIHANEKFKKTCHNSL